MISQAVQDYLKSIYKLQHLNPDDSVSTTDIAKDLDVSGASVTGMIKRLDTMGMVDYSSYKGVKLTEKGEKVALEIIRFHRLIETYLKEMLGFPLDKIHDEACRLEHHISEEFIDRINQLLGEPRFDPHGHPIPSKDGVITEYEEKPLSEIEPGGEYYISRLSDTDKKLLAYLELMNLTPNIRIKVVDKAPFKGPITISYNGSEKIIGNEVASNIFVKI